MTHTKCSPETEYAYRFEYADESAFEIYADGRAFITTKSGRRDQKFGKIDNRIPLLIGMVAKPRQDEIDRLRAAAQCQQQPVAWQRRNIGPDGKPWSTWYPSDDKPTPENMAFDGYLSYEYRPLYPGPAVPSTDVGCGYPGCKDPDCTYSKGPNTDPLSSTDRGGAK